MSQDGLEGGMLGKLMGFTGSAALVLAITGTIVLHKDFPLGTLDLDVDPRMAIHLQFSEWTLDLDPEALLLNLDPFGDVNWFFPDTTHQLTVQSISPPTLAARQLLSLMTPLLVETIAIPMPPNTRGK